MGKYTSIAEVRDITGYTERVAPSGTVNRAIEHGEAILQEYIGETPAHATGSMAWVARAASAFAAHFLCMRLATQFAPATMYAQGMLQNRGTDWGGYAVMAEHWWNVGRRILDVHGRDIKLEIVEF